MLARVQFQDALAELVLPDAAQLPGKAALARPAAPPAAPSLVKQ